MVKVIILCGGRGYRLRPLTSNLPKPMIPLNGKPVLQHIIEFYIDKGFKEFILCTGFHADSINDFILKNKFDARIEISNAGEEAGMLKRLYMVRHLIGEKAIVTYGDTLVNIDPYDVIKEHDKNKAALTITTASIRSPFGLVQFDKNNKVTSYEEKPVFSYYIGHMVMEKAILDDIGEDLIGMPDGKGLICLFHKLIKEKRLNTYRHTGLHITFNTMYEREKAEEEFVKFFTQQEG